MVKYDSPCSICLLNQRMILIGWISDYWMVNQISTIWLLNGISKNVESSRISRVPSLSFSTLWVIIFNTWIPSTRWFLHPPKICGFSYGSHLGSVWWLSKSELKDIERVVSVVSVVAVFPAWLNDPSITPAKYLPRISHGSTGYSGLSLMMQLFAEQTCKSGISTFISAKWSTCKCFMNQWSWNQLI